MSCARECKNRCSFVLADSLAVYRKKGREVERCGLALAYSELWSGIMTTCQCGGEIPASQQVCGALSTIFDTSVAGVGGGGRARSRLTVIFIVQNGLLTVIFIV